MRGAFSSPPSGRLVAGPKLERSAALLRPPASPSTNCGSRAVRQIPSNRAAHQRSLRSMLKTNRPPANPPSPIRNTECRCQERNGRCQTRSQRSETLAWSATAAVIDSDYDITCVGTMSSPQSTASQHPETQACNGKINTEPFDRCTRTIELRSSL